MDTVDIQEEKRLNRALKTERENELEILLEQDERPKPIDVDEPQQKKVLKRDLQRTALNRLEEAARTEADFKAVLEWWDRLDRNRERRERDHEINRGEVPVDYGMMYMGKVFPNWLTSPEERQLLRGNFLDTIFDCPYEMHELTADRFISKMVYELKEDHKEVLWFLYLKNLSTTELGALRDQSDRNIRKIRVTVIKKLRTRMYGYLSSKKHLSTEEADFIVRFETQREKAALARARTE